jgi:hypothetical protein
MIAGGRREDRSASTKRGNETRSLSFMSALGLILERVSVRPSGQKSFPLIFFWADPRRALLWALSL